MNLTEGTTNMYADGKSDDSIVLTTRANKAATAVAESVEERESPKGTVAGSHRRSGHCAGFRRHQHGTAMTTCSEKSFVIVDLTEEPYEVNTHVGICAEGCRQRWSLP